MHLINPCRYYQKLSCLFSIFLITCSLTGCYLSAPKYGANDKTSKEIIQYLNSNISYRSTGNFKQLEASLLRKLSTAEKDTYAVPRLYYELAELYSYQLLDIEKAIRYDELLLQQEISDYDTTGNTVPHHFVANQNILADKRYVEQYVSIKKEEILKTAQKRLTKNRGLVQGKKPKEKQYNLKLLQKHLQAVTRDLTRNNISHKDRITLISRLIKAEYEIRKQSPNFLLKGYRYFTRKEITVRTVDLLEIDFLRLADYFVLAYSQTKDVHLAEYALETIYLPYINLRNASNRWRFNRLVNQYISQLVNANYRLRNFEDTLYYASLNKSRMLLEERIHLTRQKHDRKNSNIINEKMASEIILTASGLPSKKWFKNKLAEVDTFLDFYVDGQYAPHRAISTKISYKSSMPLSTRDMGIETADSMVEFFKDTAMYVSYIRKGKVKYCKRIAGSQLTSLKKELDSSLKSITTDTKKNSRSSILKRVGKQLQLPPQLVISPDKWLARHPLNYHFDIQTIRSVNLFTYTRQQSIPELNFIGFFNPTLDLEGAEKEAEVIGNSLPGAQKYLREKAMLSHLQEENSANLVHLSMHGSFNAQKPQFSKLYFAGAALKLDDYNDPKALYAKDMAQYSLLRERDLIFAAACETGKISADQSNETELMGILRPLTVNRNKNIILALWEVDDLATLDFVKWFYSNLAETKTISEAFLYAQHKTREKYIRPYYWAPFYLSQAN